VATISRTRFALVGVLATVSVTWTSALAAGSRWGDRPPTRPRGVFVLSCGDAFEPAINNLGEIVYTQSRSDGTLSIASTNRGRLTSNSFDIRFPDINDNGEIVYSDLVAGLPSLTLLSRVRGPLFSGNLGRINNWGQVSATGFGTTPGPTRLLKYEIDGTLHELTGPAEISSTAITDDGEVTYVSVDPVLGSDVFSTARGQLTFLGNVVSHAANGIGEFIYTVRLPDNRQLLFAESGELLWNGVAGRPDLNDYGDIVFNVPVVYLVNGVRVGNFAMVLLTSRPNVYHDRFHGKGMFRPAHRAGAPLCAGAVGSGGELVNGVRR